MVFSHELIEEASGFLSFRVQDAGYLFANEAGGHRWQRVPPTERKGRVHTSTVTVAVFEEPTEQEFQLRPSDLDIKTTKGSGPGGQHRNTTDSCVVVTHIPSKTVIRADCGRSQHRNKALALGLLRARLAASQRASTDASLNDLRRGQVGSGQRGDKRRTIRTQDGIVTDHVLDKKMRLEDYLSGRMFHADVEATA